MKKDYNKILINNIYALEKAKKHLASSLKNVSTIPLNSELTEKDLIELEALTARFSRASDFLIQKFLRLIDEIELESEGTIKDRINRAEKRGIIENVDLLINIRELRNTISHEYADDELMELFKRIIPAARNLLLIIENTLRWSEKLKENK